MPYYGTPQVTPLGQIGTQGLARGTLPGTVPKTEKTTVHKGEIVIPEDQADSPLMSYLVADAMRKKVPLGRQTGGSYQKGSLGSDDEFMKWWLQQMKDKKFLDQWKQQVKQPQPSGEAPTAPYELPKDMSLLTAGDERPGRLDPSKPWMERAGTVAGRGIEAAGGAARSAVEYLGGPEGPVSSFRKGYSGEDYFADVPQMADVAEAENIAALQPSGAPTAPAAAPPSPPPPSDLETAQGRVREGDFGTPGDPLQLTGQLSEREQAYREVSGLPEQRQAKHEEGMARAEMKKVLTMLQYHGQQMDPKVKKSLMEQVSFHAQIADKWGKEIKSRQKAVEDELKFGEKASADFAKLSLIETQKADAREKLEGVRGDIKKDYAQIQDNRRVLRDAWRLSQTGKGSRERASGEMQVLRIIQGVAREEGKELSMDDAEKMMELFFGLPLDKLEGAIRAMTD
jgi:hypothetical protein